MARKPIEVEAHDQGPAQSEAARLLKVRPEQVRVIKVKAGRDGAFDKFECSMIMEERRADELEVGDVINRYGRLIPVRKFWRQTNQVVVNDYYAFHNGSMIKVRGRVAS